jgi:hypothetical protein
MILSRKPMRVLASPWSQVAEQSRQAHERMDAFEDYAREIGCTIIDDEIITDEEQSRKLATWWTDHNG